MIERRERPSWDRVLDEFLKLLMLRQGQPVFLDDMTLDHLRGQLPVPIRIVHGAADIVASVLGSVGKSP